MKMIDKRGSIAPLLWSEGMQQHRRCSWSPEKTAEDLATCGEESTGVGSEGGEPIGDSLGGLVKGLAFSASMAADLAVIEDQGQGIGEKPDHGEHHQGRGLVNRGMFEVAVGGNGLKDFRIDSPTAATALMNEQRRDRAEFEIGGVEVGALLRHRGLALDAMTVFIADGDAMLVFDANRFDDAHLAVGDGPVDLRQVPVANLPARLCVNAGGRFLGETLRLAQQIGLVLFQGEGPDQTQTFHFLNEGCLQIQSVPHQNIQETAAQLPDQILEQRQGAGDLAFAALLKAATE